MKKRQLYILLGIAVLIAGYIGMNYIAGLKEEPKKEKRKKAARKLPVLRYEPDTVTSTVPISGRVEASKKVEVYAEVSGVLRSGHRPFKEGVRFAEGTALLSMEDEESRMDLRSRKSGFLNAITDLLPDLKLDFPAAYQRWKDYLNALSIEEPLPELPKIEKQQVKYFVASRGLFERYYAIKSQEVRQSKYRIVAPFSGVVTESNIDPGTLVRNGQKLGEFIDPESYELVASIGVHDLPLVEKGDEAVLHSSEMKGEWRGHVERINHRVDQGTQTIKLYIPLDDPDLRDGVYLEGELQGSSFNGAVKIPRNLLQEERYVWTVRDSTLQKKRVETLYKLPDQAVVKGLKGSDLLLEHPFPGAYEGMPAIPVLEKDKAEASKEEAEG